MHPLISAFDIADPLRREAFNFQDLLIIRSILQDELAPGILSLLAVFPASAFTLAFFQLHYIAESILFSKKKLK